MVKNGDFDPKVKVFSHVVLLTSHEPDNILI